MLHVLTYIHIYIYDAVYIKFGIFPTKFHHNSGGWLRNNLKPRPVFFHILLPWCDPRIDCGDEESIDSSVIVGGLARVGACYFLSMMDVTLKSLRLACGSVISRLRWANCTNWDHDLDNNHIHRFMWDVITRPCHSINDGLTKLPLKLGHEYIITSGSFSGCNSCHNFSAGWAHLY